MSRYLSKVKKSETLSGLWYASMEFLLTKRFGNTRKYTEYEKGTNLCGWKSEYIFINCAQFFGGHIQKKWPNTGVSDNWWNRRDKWDASNKNGKS